LSDGVVVYSARARTYAHGHCSGLQSAFKVSPSSPARCICIAAKAKIALLTTGDSVAMLLEKVRVKVHFGPTSIGVRIGRGDVEAGSGRCSRGSGISRAPTLTPNAASRTGLKGR
jgi:hypothetical protein